MISKLAQPAEAAPALWGRTDQAWWFTLPLAFSLLTSRKEAAQRKEGKREGSKGSSHSEKMPGLGWGRTGPKLGPLRGAEKAVCFEAKVRLWEIS